jgi:hypothetical protein
MVARPAFSLLATSFLCLLVSQVETKKYSQHTTNLLLSTIKDVGL